MKPTKDSRAVNCEPYAVTKKTLFSDGYRFTSAASFSKDKRDATALAEPGAVSHQPTTTDPATMTETRISHDSVNKGNAHHSLREDGLDEEPTTLTGDASEGGGNDGGKSDMTTLIVAASTANFTVGSLTLRAIFVCVLAIGALFVIGGRIDWAALRNGGRRPTPVYLRVDRRPSPEYRRPALKRRTTAVGELAGVTIISAIVIAIAVSIVLATLVGSVTNLLR